MLVAPFLFVSQTMSAETVLPPPTRGERFEEVWRTVRDGFFDPPLRGVDWEDARRRVTPDVEVPFHPEYTGGADPPRARAVAIVSSMVTR